MIMIILENGMLYYGKQVLCLNFLPELSVLHFWLGFAFKSLLHILYQLFLLLPKNSRSLCFSCCVLLKWGGADIWGGWLLYMFSFLAGVLFHFLL